MSNEEIEVRTLRSGELRWTCPDAWLEFETTDRITERKKLLGQTEAIDALRLGIRLRAPGYNIFVAGLPGTGRTTTVRELLAEEVSTAAVPDDIVYVYDFDDPRAPRPLSLPSGKGKVLKGLLIKLHERFHGAVLATRASQQHRSRREAVARPHRERQSQVVNDFQSLVAAEGFALVEVEAGGFKRHELAPIVDGHPVALEDLAEHVDQGHLTAQDATRLRASHPGLAAKLTEVSSEIRQLSSVVDEMLAEADREAGQPLVEEMIAELRAGLGFAVGERPDLDSYVGQVSKFLLRAFPLLYGASELAPIEALAGAASSAEIRPEFHVNVLVDRSGTQGRPVIEESHPTVARLLGTVEVQRSPDGSLRADTLGLRAGALHRANGGYLIINAMELIEEEGSWMALRRVLRSGQVGFLVGEPESGPPPLVPKRVPLDVTVILVGPYLLRDRLASGDPDFDKLFKIIALFEERVSLSTEAAHSYTSFLARLCDGEHLLAFRARAVGRMLEEMVRLAGGNRKLSTRYRVLADIARESCFVAREEGVSIVEESHVARALRSRRDRASVLSKRIFESIRTNVLQLQLTGSRVGQINALAVVESSIQTFGYPVRLTATTSVGDAGIVDIEREAELSGEIHTKASLILAGFLRSLFAQDFPLSITASICFEQSYGGVEGDSASAAELAVLVSALSRVPLRQDLAVTGAVDQLGNVLAIGGVNEKIEGFWQACRDRGLTGTQGVVVPESSVSSLQLDPEVVDDVLAGRFHIYSARTFPGLMRMLTGEEFGTRNAEGTWTPGSIAARVESELKEAAEVLRRYRVT